MCRKRFFHTACNKHDWTCTVPWPVFQLCVRTLQMTMTRAWTLEMTEDWTHARITEHDKACVV